MLTKSKVQQESTATSNLLTTTQSTAVMKNCVRLALSTVAFARGLFPDEAFAPKSYAGVNIMVLSPMKDTGLVVNEDSLRLQEWLEKGAFPALDLGYLDRIMFTVLNDHPSSPTATTLENYSFKVSYKGKTATSLQINRGQSDDKAQVQGGISRDEINKMMQHMIKQLVVLTSSLAPLPNDRWLSMSLVYNASAPRGFAPQGFCEADSASLPRFAGDVLSVPVGEVRTDEHAIAIKLQQPDTEVRIEDMPTQKLLEQQQHCSDDEDNTNAGWEVKKQDFFQQALKIVQASKLDALSALKQSLLSKEVSPDVLAEFVQQMKLQAPCGSPQGSFCTQEEPSKSRPRQIARCKRPCIRRSPSPRPSNARPQSACKSPAAGRWRRETRLPRTRAKRR